MKVPDPDQPYDHHGKPEDGPLRYLERPDLEPAAQPDPGHTQNELAKAQAENKRLREALEEIAHMGSVTWDAEKMPSIVVCDEEMRTIARAALDSGRESDG